MSKATKVRPAAITTPKKEKNAVRHWGSKSLSPASRAERRQSAIFSQSPVPKKRTFTTENLCWSTHFSRDGKSVMYNDARDMVVVDLKLGNERIRQKWTMSWNYPGFITADSKSIVVVTNRSELSVIDMNSRKVIRKIDTRNMGDDVSREFLQLPQISPLHPNVLCVVSTTGHLVAYDMDKKKNLWKPKHSGSRPNVLVLSNRNAPAMVAYGGSDKKITVVDMLKGDVLMTFKRSQRVDAACFSPDDKLFAIGDYSKILTMISVGENNTWATLYNTNCGGPIFDAEFSTDGEMIACAVRDNAVLVLDVATGGIIRSIKDAQNRVAMCVGISPDSQYLSVGYDPSGVEIIDLHATKSSRISYFPTDAAATEKKVSSLTISKCGRWLGVLVGKRTYSVYRVPDTTNELPDCSSLDQIETHAVFKYTSDCDFYGGISFNYTGDKFAIGRTKGCLVFLLKQNGQEWDMTPKIQVSNGTYSLGMFGKCSNKLCYGLMGSLYVSDVEGTSVKNTKTFEQKETCSVTFSDDDKLLLVSNMQKIINLYKIATGEVLFTKTYLFQPRSLRFTPGNKYFMMETAVGMQVSLVSTGEWISEEKDYGGYAVFLPDEKFVTNETKKDIDHSLVIYKVGTEIKVGRMLDGVLDTTLTHMWAGHFGFTSAKAEYSGIRGLSVSVKKNLVAVASGPAWAVYELSGEPLPGEMPLTNGKWIKDNPILIHNRDPITGETILHRIAKEGKPEVMSEYLKSLEETKTFPAPLVDKHGVTALDCAIENENHHMCEYLTQSMGKWKHPVTMAPYVEGLKKLAKKKGFADVLVNALESAWRPTSQAVGLVRLKMSNHRFKCERYLSPCQGDPKVWVPKPTEKNKGNKEDKTGMIVDVESKLIALPCFFQEEGLFDAIAECDSLEPFTTQTMKIAIHYMWEKFGRKKYIDNLVAYCILLLSSTLGMFFNLWYEGNLEIGISEKMTVVLDSPMAYWHYFVSRGCLAISCLFSLWYGFREMQEVVHDGGFRNHFGNSVWDIMEGSTYLLLFVSSLLTGLDMSSSNIFNSAAVLMAWITLLAHLRGFKAMGSLLKKLMRIFYDMAVYMTVQTVVLIGFSMSFKVLLPGKEDWSNWHAF